MSLTDLCKWILRGLYSLSHSNWEGLHQLKLPVSILVCVNHVAIRWTVFTYYWNILDCILPCILIPFCKSSL